MKIQLSCSSQGLAHNLLVFWHYSYCSSGGSLLLPALKPGWGGEVCVCGRVRACAQMLSLSDTDLFQLSNLQNRIMLAAQMHVMYFRAWLVCESRIPLTDRLPRSSFALCATSLSSPSPSQACKDLSMKNHRFG